MSAPELSRVLDIRQCDGREVLLEATPEERAALAARFGVVQVKRLKATMVLQRDGNDLQTTGELTADLIQTCAISGEDFPVRIAEPLVLRFVPASSGNHQDEDLEIDSSDPDEIEYTETEIDLGEAIAQSLALAIDPFATGPNAEAARAQLGGEAASPFAALAALKRGPDEGSN